MRTRPLAQSFAAVAVAVAAGALAVVAAAAPAAATGDHPVCTTTKHGDTTPYVNRNAADTANTTGTFTLTTAGVKLTTPDNDAKVYGYLPLNPGVPLDDITGAGFKNTNTSGLAPSYQFGLSVNGAWGGTLAWEQTYQADGYKGTDDVLHHGNSKWYVTKDHPGYTKHTLKTWDQLVALLPKGTVATYYGLNQGAGGIATNTTDELKLSTKKWCTVHVWSSKYTSASPSPSASATKSPSPSPSASKSASPSPSTSTAPALPVTGSNGSALLLGAGLVAVGIAAVGSMWWVARRRRVRFVAE